MSVERIAIRPIELGLPTELPPLAPKAEPGKFDSILGKLLNDVNEVQQHAGDIEKQALEGTVQDIHEIMIAAEEAGIAFEMIVERVLRPI